MALNYPSCSLLLNDECSAMMRGCGCWSEEASPLSSIGVNALFWDDLEPEMDDEFDSDPVDLLPTDPFGMNLETRLTAALASCIGDLTAMSGAGRFGTGDGDAVCADLSYYLNQALALSREVVCRDAVPVQQETAPHDGMLFALGYLGLRDILSVEMVCKSLHSAVRNDPLLWKCIHVEEALSRKISDPDLLCLTQKSPGALKCLNINKCMNITDNGLNAVLESNPGLTKLSIAECARLTLDGLIANLKSFNMKAVYGIKSLRIVFNLPKKEQYEELLSLLSIDKMQELHNREPRFFRANHLLSDCSDGYALDIEMCPICQSYKPVYDCPEEECNARRSGNCRACVVCIKRCDKCGRCLERGVQFEEKFDLLYRCYKCQGDPASSPSGEK